MSIPEAEYRETAHFSNRSGVRASCADCHIPHGYPQKLWVKAVNGGKDIYFHLRGVIDTPEKFEARRLHMATAERERMQRNGSAECRHCHDAAAMNPAKQKAFARAEHQKARESGQACINCHEGIAHSEPKQPGAPFVPVQPSSTPNPSAVGQAAAMPAPAAPVAADVVKPRTTKPAVVATPAQATIGASGAAVPVETTAASTPLIVADPAMRETAAKYRGRPAPTEVLVARIMNGGEGKEHPEVDVSEQDAVTLVRWILAL